MKTLFITFTASFLLIVVPSLQADDRKVSQLEYQNCGGYTVSEFWEYKQPDESCKGTFTPEACYSACKSC